MGQKVRILKTDIDNLAQSEVVEEIGVLIAQKKLAYIVTANAEITYMAQNDAKMQQIINRVWNRPSDPIEKHCSEND